MERWVFHLYPLTLVVARIVTKKKTYKFEIIKNNKPVEDNTLSIFRSDE